MILKNRIKKIIDAIKDTDINEIEISSFWGFQKIKLKKNIPGDLKEKLITNDEPSTTINFDNDNNNSLNNEDEIAEKVVEPKENNDLELTIIKSPLVGTFYLSPKPDDDPFVSVGSVINVGDTLCIVEAMKIFNDIDSEYSGTIVEILAENNEPVEYDQPLFKIKQNNV